jgi:putative phosphoesterase
MSRARSPDRAIAGRPEVRPLPTHETERVVIGLISDTHGLVRPDVATAFAGVWMILHAGDVGGPAALAALSAIAPVEAVYGNVDDTHDPALSRERVVTLAGVTIHVSHGHELGSPTPALVLARYSGDVVVFGHTHRAVVQRDASGRLAINPGAAGPRRFNLQPSVGKLTIANGAATVEIIPLD